MALRGKIQLPGDKSITHRALLISSLANGTSRISNALKSEDTLNTLAIMRELGVTIKEEGNDWHVHGTGNQFSATDQILDCGNSGTTARLLLGLLSGRPYPYQLIGDDSLNQRPMCRVVVPLKVINGNIELTKENFLPATIHPTRIQPGVVEINVPSAQVKSAVLLAALQSSEPTIVICHHESRDHTERMLTYFGADIHVNNQTIQISGRHPLQAKTIKVPGDVSSAAFFMIGALLIPDSHLLIENCGINPTRSGLIDLLQSIGANITLHNQRLAGLEPVADIEVQYTAELKPFTIDGEMMPRLIDEVPILSLLATQIKGTSTIREAEELRIKETDRIHAVVTLLTQLGVKVTEFDDGLQIKGPQPLNQPSERLSSYGDHRISMMLKIAELITGPLQIIGREVDAISYPQFEQDLKKLVNSDESPFPFIKLR